MLSIFQKTILAQYFLVKYGEENQKPALDLTPEALHLLEEYNWPGNVRELENYIERAVVVSRGPMLDTADFPKKYAKIVKFGPSPKVTRLNARF